MALAAAPDGFMVGTNNRRVRATSLTEPSPTQTGSLHPAVVIPMHEHGRPRDAHTEELNTVAASGNHHGLLIPYYGQGEAHPTTEPTRTMSSREHEALVMPALPDIEDCTFRMLQPHEIQAAMAFPSDYTILGTSREKVKQLGNAVVPSVAHAILQRCIETLAG
jgi:DNA (cytosine-5)-methyltransferase 1